MPEPPQPRIPAAVAHALALRSEAVATSLDQGDACAATTAIADLHRAARAAVATGQVPRTFRRTLLRAVERIRSAAPACVPPALPGDEGGNGQRDHGRGKGHGKKRGDGDGNGGEQ